MQKTLLLTCALLVQLISFAADTSKIKLIPEPVSLKELPGNFTLTSSVGLEVSSADPKLETTAQWFASQLKALTGIPLKQKNFGKLSTINLLLLKDYDKSLGEEGYKLTVERFHIHLRANTSAGIFYGMQTLLQMVPLLAGNASSPAPRSPTIPVSAGAASCST
jgi:hexosaminidase